MPQAVTHVLITMILLSLFRDYYHKYHQDKKRFPLHYVLIGGIAGLLPDIDIAAYYVLSFFGFGFNEVHRIFSHNIFIPILFLLLGFIFLGFKNKELGKHHLKLSNISFVIAFGFLVHLVLDAIVSGIIVPFYPFSSYKFGFSLVNLFPGAWRNTIIPSIDAILLVLWIIYLEVKHKISNFI